jgi:aminoglycoside phosphotransferase family enzyme
LTSWRSPAQSARRSSAATVRCWSTPSNIALIDGRVTLFDRLEFNESMRWIDVMNDVAFVIVDLQERKRPDLAARFLTAYLEATDSKARVTVLSRPPSTRGPRTSPSSRSATPGRSPANV